MNFKILKKRHFRKRLGSILLAFVLFGAQAHAIDPIVDASNSDNTTTDPYSPDASAAASAADQAPPASVADQVMATQGNYFTVGSTIQSPNGTVKSLFNSMNLDDPAIKNMIQNVNNEGLAAMQVEALNGGDLAAQQLAGLRAAQSYIYNQYVSPAGDLTNQDPYVTNVTTNTGKNVAMDSGEALLDGNGVCGDACLLLAKFAQDNRISFQLKTYLLTDANGTPKSLHAADEFTDLGVVGNANWSPANAFQDASTYNQKYSLPDGITATDYQPALTQNPADLMSGAGGAGSSVIQGEVTTQNGVSQAIVEAGPLGSEQLVTGASTALAPTTGAWSSLETSLVSEVATGGLPTLNELLTSTLSSIIQNPGTTVATLGIGVVVSLVSDYAVTKATGIQGGVSGLWSASGMLDWTGLTSTPSIGSNTTIQNCNLGDWCQGAYFNQSVNNDGTVTQTTPWGVSFTTNLNDPGSGTGILNNGIGFTSTALGNGVNQITTQYVVTPGTSTQAPVLATMTFLWSQQNSYLGATYYNSDGSISAITGFNPITNKTYYATPAQSVDQSGNPTGTNYQQYNVAWNDGTNTVASFDQYGYMATYSQTNIVTVNESLSGSANGLPYINTVTPVDTPSPNTPLPDPTPAPTQDLSGTSVESGTLPSGATYQNTITTDASGNVIASTTMITSDDQSTVMIKDNLAGTSVSVTNNPDGTQTTMNCSDNGATCFMSNSQVIANPYSGPLSANDPYGNYVNTNTGNLFWGIDVGNSGWGYFDPTDPYGGQGPLQ